MGKKNDTTNPAAAIAAGPASSKTIPQPTVPAVPAEAPKAPGPNGDGAAGAPAKSAAKKKPASKGSKTSKTATKVKAVSFSTDDIALRAYFISESRSRNGIPGDSHSDWLEAERQLRSERRKTAPAKVSKASKGSRSKKRS